MALFVLAIALVVLLAPWRHPATRYFVLLLPIYTVFFGAIGWAVWRHGGLEQTGLKAWNLFWVLPCLLPFVTIGGKCWTTSQH